jgi:hypothetical protein
MTQKGERAKKAAELIARRRPNKKIKNLLTNK